MWDHISLKDKMTYLDILSERQGWGNQSELASALADPNPLWIRFGAPLTITGPLSLTSNKTIDGRDFPGKIKVTGDNGGLKGQDVNNIILIGLDFDGGWANYKTDSEGSDGLQLRNASNIWIHHCRFAQWRDGCIDAKEGTKNLSVTWSRFDKHLQALLWMANGATLAYCYATNLGRRFPKAVGGKIHAYNNVIASWTDVEIECARDGGQLLSEYSYFIPSKLYKVGLVVAGGSISSKNHSAKNVKFLNTGSVSSSFASDSRARAKITKTLNSTLRSKIQNAAGPTRSMPTEAV
jgi:pectate lyase